MTAAIPRTAVGVFKDRGQAESAVQDLRGAGFSQDQIGVAVRHEEELPMNVPTTPETKAPEGTLAGALTGGALGGLLGAVAAGLIPGVGPFLGAGILAAAAGGAAAGAAAGGLLGALIGLGIPEEEARYYHTEVESGRTLVTVKAGDRYEQAVDILRRHGAYGKGSPLI
jgi:hypothetical protein